MFREIIPYVLSILWMFNLESFALGRVICSLKNECPSHTTVISAASASG